MKIIKGEYEVASFEIKKTQALKNLYNEVARQLSNELVKQPQYFKESQSNNTVKIKAEFFVLSRSEFKKVTKLLKDLKGNIPESEMYIESIYHELTLEDECCGAYSSEAGCCSQNKKR